jgi:glyoxylase-like metal-dependent hydrolase (beta-lactamase superfamily II)
LFLQQGKGVLIVGDALIGKPPGSVSLLPVEKYADAGKAHEGLRRLLKYNFDSLLVGDGASILTGAKQAVERLLQPSS